MGFRSELFAEHIDARILGEIHPIDDYAGSENELLLVHPLHGHDKFDDVTALANDIVTVFHNITPAPTSLIQCSSTTYVSVATNSRFLLAAARQAWRIQTSTDAKCSRWAFGGWMSCPYERITRPSRTTIRTVFEPMIGSSSAAWFPTSASTNSLSRSPSSPTGSIAKARLILSGMLTLRRLRALLLSLAKQLESLTG